MLRRGAEQKDAVDGHQRKADAQVDVLVPLTLPSHNERPGTDEFTGLCGFGDLGRFDRIHRAVTATAAPCAAPAQGQLCTCSKSASVMAPASIMSLNRNAGMPSGK